jgi:hypothetical protein
MVSGNNKHDMYLFFFAWKYMGCGVNSYEWSFMIMVFFHGYYNLYNKKNKEASNFSPLRQKI